MALGSKAVLRKVRGHPKYAWRASFIEGGARRFKYFTTKAAGEAWVEGRNEEAHIHGTTASLTAAERSAVLETREALEREGLDARAAIEFAIFAKRRLEGLDLTPEAAVEFAASHQERARRSVSVAELVEELIESKIQSGRSRRHERDLRSKLGRLSLTFGDRSVATLEAPEIEAWLHQLRLAAGSINSYRRILNVAFRFAIKRGYRPDNPIAGIERVSPPPAEIEILTVEELDRLLTQSDERITAAIAIAAFAGLRTAEIEGTIDHPGLKWSEIDFHEGTILVRAEVAKGRSRRHVPISDNLRAWLLAFPRRLGKVWPPNGRKLHEAARRAAGFGLTGEETEAERAQGISLRPWPKNALRHSYATYHLAQHRNAAELVLNMGHQDDAETLFNHYRGLVKPTDATRYWSLRPAAEGPGTIRLTG